MTWRLGDNFHDLGSGVFLVVGPASNWVIVHDAAGSLLIDGGYPADGEIVTDSLHRAGVFSLPDAVLLTHAHIDHMGAALRLAQRGVPVWCSAAELGNATGSAPEQIAPHAALSLAEVDPLWQNWAQHALQAGGLTKERLSRAELHLFSPDVVLDVPGAPRALASSGHTSGHVSVECGEVLVAGDAIITDHPTSARHGPQLLHELFHHAPHAVSEAATDLLGRTAASVVAPGHGEPVSTSHVRECLPLSDSAGNLN